MSDKEEGNGLFLFSLHNMLHSKCPVLVSHVLVISIIIVEYQLLGNQVVVLFHNWNAEL